MVKTRHSRKSQRNHRVVRSKTSKNTSRKMREPSTVIGVIHANWCGICVELMPKWKVFKNELKGNKNISIVDIEDKDPKKSTKMNTLNMKINDKSVRLNADGFPTIFKIQNGHLEYYNGVREPAPLKRWALGQHKQPLPTPPHVLPAKKPRGFFGLF